MFVDSHCHLEMEDYDKDREAVIDRAIKDGIRYIVTAGTEVKYFQRVLDIIEAYPQVYGIIGIHPHNARDYSDGVEKTVKGYLRHKKIVGYGEIGLDFFKNYSPRDAQIEAFKKQIKVARQAGLPIIIHSRAAEKETLEILASADLAGRTVIIHCYSYGLDTAKKMVDLGFYLSVPGTITYKNTRLVEVVRSLPLDRLLSETDAPFLTPEPRRGKRNEPALVRLVVEEIARIKGRPVKETADALRSTFERLFLTGK